MVSVKDGSTETDLYTKPIDKHQYLLVSSSTLNIPNALFLLALHVASVAFALTQTITYYVLTNL